MNNNSYICKFISQNKNWQEDLNIKYGIDISIEDNLALFKYRNGCDFFNPIVQEARGIIIDTDSLEVVCWPFRKFGNFQEAYADKIDWVTARVQEKLDGSIIKLWYNKKNKVWYFSTNGVINAKNAMVNGLNCSYYNLITQTKEFKELNFDFLNPDYTYIFELVSPNNKLVISYPCSKLYHTGTRDNITGIEQEIGIGITKPKQYAAANLEEAINLAYHLNQKDKDPEHEGFVVVDNHWNRIKIKTPEYLLKNHLCTSLLSKRFIIDYLLDHDLQEKELVSANQKERLKILFYSYKLHELQKYVEDIAFFTLSLKEEYNNNRKIIASFLCKNPILKTGFFILDHPEVSLDKIIFNLNRQIIENLIPDFNHHSIDDFLLDNSLKL